MSAVAERNPLSVSFWKSQGVDVRHTIYDCRPCVMIRTNRSRPYRMLTRWMWAVIEYQVEYDGLSLFDATRNVLVTLDTNYRLNPKLRPTLADLL